MTCTVADQVPQAFLYYKSPEACMDLTPVEVETLRWIAAGKTLMEISVIREISEQTVKKQAAALREKLGAMTSAHAVSIAIGKGIIEAQNA